MKQELMALGLMIFGVSAVASAQEQAITSGNYLYIEEYEIAPGRIPNEAIAEVSKWVRTFRATGEYKSVRLYIHNSGPKFALYILAEPKSWQSIETGGEKFLAATPELMSQPFMWGRHTDNILSEIPVR